VRLAEVFEHLPRLRETVHMVGLGLDDLQHRILGVLPVAVALALRRADEAAS